VCITGTQQVAWQRQQCRTSWDHHEGFVDLAAAGHSGVGDSGRNLNFGFNVLRDLGHWFSVSVGVSGLSELIWDI
jgi:hypothetical protein